MLVRWQIDTYMVVALIIIPILNAILEVHGEIASLKEESKHQRKFVMDRYSVLNDKIAELTTQLERKVVVDFAEFAKNTEVEKPAAQKDRQKPRRKKKRKPLPEITQSDVPEIDLSDPEQNSISET